MFEGPATTELGTNLRSYSEEDVNLVLRVLAYNGGNLNLTVAELEDKYGKSITSQTVARWRSTLFAQRYTEIQYELQSEINKKLAGVLAENGIKSAQAQAEMIDRLMNEVNSLEPKQLATAARELAQVQSIAVDKSSLLRGLPTQIHAERKPEDVVRALKELNIVEAEVVEGDEDE